MMLMFSLLNVLSRMVDVLLIFLYALCVKQICLGGNKVSFMMFTVNKAMLTSIIHYSHFNHTTVT